MALHTATTRRDGNRLWSRALAAIISLCLVVSLFHCCCIDGDDETSAVAVVQTRDAGAAAQSGKDQPGKTAPCSASAHCCHCLAHVTTVASQSDIVTIAYVTRLDRIAAAPAPDAADRDS